MARRSEPKKSETLEVRLSLESKEAFKALCRREGLTASEAVRAYVDRSLAGTAARERRTGRSWRLAVGAAAAPTLAHPLRANRPGCAPTDVIKDLRAARP